MHSLRRLFISNSKERSIGLPIAGAALSFVATVGLLWVWSKGSSGQNLDVLGNHPATGSEDYSLVYDGQKAVDQHRYFHNDGGIADFARGAEVLFLGNSRMVCAIDFEVVASEMPDRKVYNLGFGYDEAGDFALEVIERYGLWPEIAIVNCDESFFRAPSAVGGEVMKSTHWANAVELWEFETAWWLRRTLERWVPKIAHRDNIAIWRRHDTGEWIVKLRRLEESEVRVSSTAVDPEALAPLATNALRFMERMREHGTKVVLTVVPSPTANLRFAEFISVRTGAPLVHVDSDLSFTSFDGDHLTQRSARLFSAALWRELRAAAIL
jgi:hypothetical protein